MNVQSSEIERLIPEIDEQALAVEVFDNICFYRNELFLDMCRELRKETLKEMTVKEVYMKFTKDHRDDPDNGLKDLGLLIGCLMTPLSKYFKSITTSVEDILEQMQSIALTDKKDVEIFKARPVASLPTSRMILSRTMSTFPEKKRANNLGIVLGSSGSGKSFFALNDLAREFLTDEKKYVKTAALHIYPNATGIPFFMDNKQENPNAAAAVQLCEWIKDTLAQRIKKEIKKDYKLKMHLCIIFDEAGDLNIRPWFESKTMLTRLCEYASDIAESVAIVLAGTALTGKELSSKDDAYIFRMQPWNADDFVLTLKSSKNRLLEPDDTLDMVAKAVFSHPKLGSLATNGRSAYFLSKAIANLSLQYRSVVWKRQLDEWAPTLVSSVVEGYIDSNGIQSLLPPQRRLLAASVFHALQETKRGHLSPPDFVALKDNEIAIAHSLVQYNLERGKNKLVLVSNESFAISVTPAIAIVLYAMAGIPTTLMPGWKAEEELAALYAVRQLMLACIKTYENKIPRFAVNNQSSDDYACEQKALSELKQSLEKIELLKLQTQLKPKPPMHGNILIPMVGASTVLLNADKASFADVIAPGLLIQTKQKTSKQQDPVDMVQEMGKCRLIKSKKQDDWLLRGLKEMWKGKLQPSTTTNITDDTMMFHQEFQSHTQPDQSPQHSEAFPENLLCLAKPRGQCQYATIETGGKEITIGNERHPLPLLNKTTTITFLLSTNVNDVKLKLHDGYIITISQKNLDQNLCIDTTTFSDKADKTAWTTFVRDKVRKDIKISCKFLLTKSV